MTGAMAEAVWPYLTVTGAAFLAATLLPFPSEAVLIGHIVGGFGARWPLVTAASVGNTAGAVFNWWIGRELLRFQDRRWFPFSASTIDAASDRFRRWGPPALLLSWVPVIGDPLTLVAGVLRVPLVVFVPLVAAGKVARYVVIVWPL
jgi:membrane protein YqaA with SNARE-associated domain